MSNYFKHFDAYRLKSIAVFAVAIIIVLNRLLGGSLPQDDTYRTAFLFGENETIYHIFSSSKISWLLSGLFFVCLFDFLILLFPVLFAITLKRIYAVLFFLLVLIYFLYFNLISGHHYHGLVGLIVITIPFWFKKEGRFNALWQIARYYWLYIFVSAALWKILRGTVFYKEQLSDILKAQQLDLLLQNPNSFCARAVEYLISHPDVSHLVLLINVILQLSFLVGFFTKKYDMVLFWLAIIFCAANYFVMSIVSTELLILNLTLINWDKIVAWHEQKSFQKGTTYGG